MLDKEWKDNCVLFVLIMICSKKIIWKKNFDILDEIESW